MTKQSAVSEPGQGWGIFFAVSGVFALLLSLAVLLGHNVEEGKPVAASQSPPVVEKKPAAGAAPALQPFTVRFPPMPDFNSYRDVKKRKEVFIDYLTPIIEYQNQQILLARERLYRIARTILGGEEMSETDRSWLRMMAEKYGVEWREDEPGIVVVYLARKVDIIPVSLAIVQAAKESSWGRSRYALEAHNLFGQWCFEEGCGVVPGERKPGARHEVRKYDSVSDAARSYIHNLNTHPRYRELREIRQRLRMRNQPVSGTALAEGLLYYSEKRQAYVEEVKSMLKQYRRFQDRRRG